MLRLDPEFLTRTSFREDFAEGIARWSHIGTEGVVAVASPDDAKQKVLRMSRPKAEVPAGACLNFPFAAKGELRLTLRIEPGFGSAHVALADHFSLPGIEKDGCFGFCIDGGGELKYVSAEKTLGATGAVLKPGAWHDVSVAWDCAAGEATLLVDNKRVARLPQLASAPGVCYLRVRLLAAKTDEAGLFIRSVETTAVSQ
jgi:hypothetical protein